MFGFGDWVFVDGKVIEGCLFVDMFFVMGESELIMLGVGLGV